MLRSSKRLYPLVSFNLLFSRRNHENDVDLLNRPSTEPPKTGWERIKIMYQRDDNEEVSIELRNVGQSVMAGAVIGACIGGFVQSRNAYLYFIENNQATIFKSTMEAKKKLQDFVTVAFAKGAVRWGWRLALFTGIFSLTATTLTVYRGEDPSLIDYISAGALAGGAYKLNLGLAATFVGAGLGAALGTIFGALIIALLKISGAKMQDVRRALLAFDEGRKQQMHEVYEKSATIKHDALTKHHDMLVEVKGKRNLDEIK